MDGRIARIAVPHQRVRFRAPPLLKRSWRRATHPNDGRPSAAVRTTTNGEPGGAPRARIAIPVGPRLFSYTLSPSCRFFLPTGTGQSQAVLPVDTRYPASRMSSGVCFFGHRTSLKRCAPQPPQPRKTMQKGDPHRSGPPFRRRRRFDAERSFCVRPVIQFIVGRTTPRNPLSDRKLVVHHGRPCRLCGVCRTLFRIGESDAIVQEIH